MNHPYPVCCLFGNSIKHFSIKSYLAAVRHWHIQNGYALDLKKFLWLENPETVGQLPENAHETGTYGRGVQQSGRQLQYY